MHVECVGPWTITANNGAKFVFSALTSIDPVTNLVDIVLLDGSNPGAQYCGEKFESVWLSRYSKPNRYVYDNDNGDDYISDDDSGVGGDDSVDDSGDGDGDGS